jgi:site-specific recombinase XerD
MDLLSIRDYLRHESVQTTQIYAKADRKLVDERWKEVFEKK